MVECIRNPIRNILRIRVMVEAIRSIILNLTRSLILSITTITLRTRVIVERIRSLIRSILRLRGMVECIHNTIIIPWVSLLG